MYGGIMRLGVLLPGNERRLGAAVGYRVRGVGADGRRLFGNPEDITRKPIWRADAFWLEARAIGV